jgi:hypothetical protein
LQNDEEVDLKEARLLVHSEDEPARLLLETSVTKGDAFQKQQGKSAPSKRSAGREAAVFR